MIEDNHGDALLVQRAFKKAAIPGNVTVAPTAEIGLCILRREGGFSHTPYPDLILLDVNLPYMGGGEFLELVKADPELRLIPVIIMSSSKAERDIQSTYKTYANGFVIKPFIAHEYDDVIKSIEDYWFQLNETPETHAPVPPAAHAKAALPAY
ncbi:response regulator [Asticcacaulis biprosthecium C19]|uniref:Response regulator n=1 Tax=Asticcacaulis biprosthecium C19 TaxID=715226 RepID=F4QHM5_9CAUL|nr:response regulator [Asticcacaulis biprosthecium C19]